MGTASGLIPASSSKYPQSRSQSRKGAGESHRKVVAQAPGKNEIVGESTPGGVIENESDEEFSTMGAFIRRHRWLSASLMLVAGLIGWWVSGGIRGQLVAHFDVARGHYEILSLGFPAPWRSEFARILRERYGIEQRVVAGCMVTLPLLAYTEGYNRVSMTAANRKFGRDVFKESAVDAMWRMRPLMKGPL